MAKEKKNVGFQELNDNSVETVSGGYIVHHKGTETFNNDGTALLKKRGSYSVYSTDGSFLKRFDDSESGLTSAKAFDKEING